MGTVKTVEKLLKRMTKAELNALYYWTGWTLLIYAVDCDKPEIVELLLQLGADVNGTDDIGETALCRAVVRNQSHLVRLLLKRGACRFIKGLKRGDAIDIAKDFAKKIAMRRSSNYWRIILKSKPRRRKKRC